MISDLLVLASQPSKLFPQLTAPACQQKVLRQKQQSPPKHSARARLAGLHENNREK